VEETLAATQAFHFQIEFPEVFWRENPGFDVIMGNPPWEKAHVEVHEFWSRHIPGFKGLKQSEREILYPKLHANRPDLIQQFENEVRFNQHLRNGLLHGNFKGMGTGHPDLYKAFCWRFLHVCRNGGHIGIVLPRAVFSSLGTSEFRKELLKTSSIGYLTTMTNSRGWVFEDVHPQYTVALAVFCKGESGQSYINLNGPFSSLATYISGKDQFIEFPLELLENATDDLIFPLLPTVEQLNASNAMRKMLEQPRLDSRELEWRFRPIQGDINATHGKPYFDFEDIDDKLLSGKWKVYKGASFDVHTPDRGEYYATIDPGTAKKTLQDRRLRSRGESAFREKGTEWMSDTNSLPCLHPRIAFRNISRATDTRTIRCSIIPAKVVVQHSASYLLRIHGDEADEAYVLAALGSIPVDWLARRFIEIQVGFYIFNPIRIPLVESDNPARKRIESIIASLYCGGDSSITEWARKVSADCVEINNTERNQLIYEIEGIICQLFDLNEQEIKAIYKSFHHDGTVDGVPWQQRFDAVIEHYRRWNE